MRRGFTMIELIFVIVIIGILAIVALPRMGKTTNLAKTALVKEFIGTLNRTVGATMWAEAVNDGNGSIRAKCPNIARYTEIPKFVKVEKNCSLSLQGLNANLTGSFIDGNISSAPRWDYSIIPR